ELVDFGGTAASAGRSRVPQVKYTYQGPYGSVWTIGAENPNPALTSRNSAVVDTNSIPGISPCSVTLNISAATPATTACAGSPAFFDLAQQEWPEVIGTARINQAWGHRRPGSWCATIR